MTLLRIGYRPRQVLELVLAEVELDQPEELPLLETHVICELLAEISNLVEHGLLGQGQSTSSNLEMLAGQSRDRRLINGSKPRPAGQEHLLLDAKVDSSLGLPEAQKQSCRGPGVFGPAHLQRHAQGLMMVSRERAQGR